MGKCVNCNVNIKDNVEICPLCGSALQKDGTEYDTYPSVWVRSRKLVVASRIFLFAAIVLFSVIVFINYKVESDTWWSFIVGLILLYVYLILRVAILGKGGYREKVLIMGGVAVPILIAVDYIIGYNGWSVNFVFPAIILAIDAAIAVLMIVNHKNWQSYIMWQIVMIIASLIPFILSFVGVVTVPTVANVALAVSFFLFLGTMIIGDRRARVELKRRFHFR